MKTRRLRRKTSGIPKVARGQIWPKGSIVYICGEGRVQFGPSDKDLGGSEQAVVQLSKAWSELGFPVVVYGNVKEIKSDGVEYRDIGKLHLADTFDIAIFWRSYGVRLFPLIKARIRLIDLHDSWDPKSYVSPKELLEADSFMLKSNYHRTLYPYIPNSKIKIVMNGIQVDVFDKAIKIPSKRDPHRFIYASMYDRGLEPILKYTWPRIKKAIPDATFHIFYGMGHFERSPLGQRLRDLFKQPGVEEHGRVSLEEIAKQKAKSGFHLYISNSETEIDCISIRESLLCGSIPVIGNDHVFSEREGIHVNGSTDNSTTFTRAASIVIGTLKRGPEFLEKKRAEFKKSKTIVSWEEIAKKWIPIFKV
jgi:hypothetical protein